MISFLQEEELSFYIIKQVDQTLVAYLRFGISYWDVFSKQVSQALLHHATALRITQRNIELFLLS